MNTFLHTLVYLWSNRNRKCLQLSKPIKSKEAKELGLIDAIVSSDELLRVSRSWALEIAERRKPWMSSLRRTDKIGSLSEAREIFKAARARVKQIAPNMPQHRACLEAIEEGVLYGGYAGVLKVSYVCTFRRSSCRCASILKLLWDKLVKLNIDIKTEKWSINTVYGHLTQNFGINLLASLMSGIGFADNLSTLLLLLSFFLRHTMHVSYWTEKSLN